MKGKNLSDKIFVSKRKKSKKQYKCRLVTVSAFQLDSAKEYRVRFSTGNSSICVNTEVPPRLFQYLPQALSTDAVPDDVLLGEVEASPKHLQVIKLILLGLTVKAKDFVNKHDGTQTIRK